MEATENWKVFPLDSRYEISDLGRVRNIQTQKIRKTPLKQNGYPGLVFTYSPHKPKGYDLHTMVALTWLGPRPQGYDVSHQDGDRSNNKVSNLKYESRKENANKTFNKFNSGYKVVLTAKDVRRIRKDRKLTNNQWAAKLGVGRTTIWKVRTYITWKHLP